MLNRRSGSAVTADEPSMIPGISRNVLTLGIVSLLTDISSEMVYPILPLFLANVLGAPLAVIGLIEGVAECTASLLRVVSGWLSDRAGWRKPFIFSGYALSNASKPLLALAVAWPQVLGIRFAERFGKGIRSAPRDALIADSTSTALRGRAFGFHRMLDTTGAAIGPLVAFAILGASHDNYRMVFVLAAIPGLFSLLVLASFLRDARQAPAATSVSRTSGLAPRLGGQFRALGRPFVEFTVITALFTLGNSSDAFLILRTENLGVAAAVIPLVYLSCHLVHAALAMPAGVISDRIGRQKVLVIGYVLFAAIYLGFAMARGAVMAWALFAAYGGFYALTEGVQRAFVGDLVPLGWRGSAMGIFNAAIGIAALPASIVAGVLWQLVSPEATFLYGAALAAVAAGLLIVVHPSPKTQPQETR